MMMVYQLKVGLCLIAFYLLFKLLLSRETFHRFNRVALLVMTLLALVLPWVKLSIDHTSTLSEAVIDLEGFFMSAQTVDEGQAGSGAWHLSTIVAYIYYIGIATVIVWQLYVHLRLHRLLRRGRTVHEADGVQLHIMAEDIAPFSYFRHIVISERDYQENAREILTHERAHIRLHHSLDVRFLDLLIILQWWNPAAWLLKRELQQIHEFEADEAVLQRGVDAQQYQLLLIRKSVGDQLFSMANNLNHNSLKRRIRMMKQKRSSRWQRLKLLAIVPLAEAAVVAFASPNVENVLQQVAPVDNAPTEVPEVTVMGYANSAAPEDTTKTFDVVEQMPEFPGGQTALMEFLMQTMKYPKDAMEAQAEGRVIVTFVVDAEGNVVEPKVLKKVHPSLDAEAVRVVSAMPKWKPGRQSGKAVRVKYTIPIAFKLKGNGKATPSDNRTGTVLQSPLVVVDGQEVTGDSWKSIDPNDIESVTVLKDKEATNAYGEKGKNGVLIIQLKKK